MEEEIIPSVFGIRTSDFFPTHTQRRYFMRTRFGMVALMILVCLALPFSSASGQGKLSFSIVTENAARLTRTSADTST